MVVYVGFTALTSNYGDEALAVGTIMMKLFMVFSYVVDGFAYAGEALVGRFIGAHDRPQAVRAVRLLFVWTLGVGLIFTLLYLFGGEQMIHLMTKEQSVIEGSRPFLFWLVLMPLISCAAFMWDGVYIGATAGRQVRDCMLFAALGFVLSYAGLFRFIGILRNDIVFLK
jgi:MATE family multidrug resistance protein